MKRTMANPAREKKIPRGLYQKIIRTLPIACVDLVVVNKRRELLLLKRENYPAKGQWWFPGGRIRYGETRKQAAVRKLFEECGLRGTGFEEIGTFDCFLRLEDDCLSHGVTTIFKVSVSGKKVSLDAQSKGYRWKAIDAWKKQLRKEKAAWLLRKTVETL